MQMKKASELSQDWGKKPCDHPSFDKEYHLGAHTGDYVCEQCGESFSPGEKDEIVAKREPRQHS